MSEKSRVSFNSNKIMYTRHTIFYFLNVSYLIVMCLSEISITFDIFVIMYILFESYFRLIKHITEWLPPVPFKWEKTTRKSCNVAAGFSAIVPWNYLLYLIFLSHSVLIRFQIKTVIGSGPIYRIYWTFPGRNPSKMRIRGKQCYRTKLTLTL